MPGAGQRPVDPTAVDAWGGREDVLANPQRGRPVGGRAQGPPGGKKVRKKGRRRKIAAIASATTIVLFVVTMGAGYALLNVPLPEEVPLPQTSFVYSNDGRSLINQYAVENREDVQLKTVPGLVQLAVIAAEDRSFYENNGISITGIGRAISGLVTGQDKGGGSTITQQYIKNTKFESQQRSFIRKAEEIPLAIKADEKYGKEKILEFYLNTIYFGRNAYGIQAASRAYFRKTVDKLTAEEGAVLAGLIKDPTNLDPQNNKAAAENRWQYVLGGMVEMRGKYTPAMKAAAVYPTVLPPQPNNFRKGSNGVLVKAIENEVADLMKWERGTDTVQRLGRGGYRITSTIDPRIQSAAVKAAQDGMKDPKIPKTDTTLDNALVAVQPGTGRVLAYYGGKEGYGDADMASRNHPHFPGSSMKPYVLAEAVEQGISVKSVWDGSSPRIFEKRGKDKPLKNAGNVQCPRCTLLQSTAKSLNTVYWALAEEVGPDKVRDLVADAGIGVLGIKDRKNDKGEIVYVRTPTKEATPDGRIGIGAYEIPVIDHAGGYATFAAEGMYTATHLVEKITDAKGTNVLFDFKKQGGGSKRAFGADAARDAGFAMQGVIKATSQAKLKGGRPAAGKTGTQDLNRDGGDNQNSNIWMAGYTPQLAAAVWMGHRDGEKALKFAGRNGSVGANIGSTYTAGIWKAFMDAALINTPIKELPEPAFAGDESRGELIAPPSTNLPPPAEGGDQGGEIGLPPLEPSQGPQSPEPTQGPPDPEPSFPDPRPSKSPRPPGNNNFGTDLGNGRNRSGG